MKIAYLITSLDFGGAEMQVAALANAFAEQNHQVWVISMIPINQTFISQHISKKVEVFSLGMTRKKISFKALIGLIRFLRVNKIQLLHNHMIHANIMGRVTRLFFTKHKIITTAHNIYEGGKHREYMYKLTNFLSDYNTNVSEIATNRYIKKRIFPKYKTECIANGVRIAVLEDKKKLEVFKETYKPHHTFLWLAVGRIEPPKDYPNLIAAAKILKVNNDDFKILIAGTGSLLKEMQQLVTQENLEENIQFLGLQKNIHALMQVSDAFVMSSEWEGLPIVILEALSNHLPAVVTNAGGNSEAIIDKKNGYVVPIKNPNALAEKMQQMMELNPAEYQNMKKEAQQVFLKKYELQKIVCQWKQIYINLLNKA